MERKIKTSRTNWALVESLASKIYPDEYQLLTANDIDEIKESIENNTPIEIDETEGGDMDFPIGETIATFTLGMTAIQTAIVYMQWKNKQVHQISPKEIVEKMLSDMKFGNSLREDIRAELKRKRSQIDKYLEEYEKDITSNELIDDDRKQNI